MILRGFISEGMWGVRGWRMRIIIDWVGYVKSLRCFRGCWGLRGVVVFKCGID